MTDIWSGDIILHDGSLIKEVGLAAPNVSSWPLYPATTLRFLSAVATAHIPLYLAAGPSLDVWTTCEATEAWFESMLLSKPAAQADTPVDAVPNEWWSLARSQSPIGILVQVQSEKEELQSSRVTEMLFYGTIAVPTTGGLPTPPSISPAAHLPELRVHALPLSSGFLYAEVAEPMIGDGAQFLPPVEKMQSVPKSPKRKRDLFEEATIANRKIRGKGGQGISAVAARGNESQQSYDHRRSLSGTRASSRPDTRATSTSSLPGHNARPLSRSPSVSSDSRPLGRKGNPEAHNRRSHLSQVVTVPLQPEEPTTELRNKEALSKVVMAAMRMHGLQQKRKIRSRRASIALGIGESPQLSDEAAAEEVAKDDEYKLIYHQTYKGAALALRRHIADKPLHAQPDRLRDVVERLLTMFLTDPLAEPLPSTVPADPVATPGKIFLGMPGSSHSHASPFDLPSIARRPGMSRSVTKGHVYTGSPVGKRHADGHHPKAT